MKKAEKVLLSVVLSLALILAPVLPLEAFAASEEKTYVLTGVFDSGAEGYSYEDRLKMVKDYYERYAGEGFIYDYDWQIEDGRHYYHVKHRSHNIYPPFYEVTQDLTTIYTAPSGFAPKSTVKVPFSMGWKGINHDGTGSLGACSIILFGGDDPATLELWAGKEYYVGHGQLELKDEFQYKLPDYYDYKYICIGVYSSNFMAGGLGKWYVYELKEEADKPAAATAAANWDLKGEWDIYVVGLIGKINITNQQGSRFSGKINIDPGATEDLTDGNLSGNNVAFTRQWPNNSFAQYYTGALTTSPDGKIKMEGIYTSPGVSYSWTATKAGAAIAPETTSAAPLAPVAGTGAEAFESGARIMWQPADGIGYRLFRSTSKNALGMSATDFYITSTSYADVNVEPNTTYYYTVKPVLAEARPFEGIDEKLGAAIATFTVTTGDMTYKPGSYKHFIVLKVDSPLMSVDGISQEVDQGRGTTPLYLNGKTMVPITAVVMAMGGTVGWEGTSQKVTLKARGNTVEMWVGKTDLTVNGAKSAMDVAPIIINGRTFVPLRFATENLNSKVDWINSTKEAVIIYVE